MATSEADPSGGHRAARRALQLIELVALAETPPNLSDLSRDLDIPKSSAHALVTTLVSEGHLERGATGRDYVVGPRLIRLLGHVRDTQLSRVARPIMWQLVVETGETALLGVRRGDSVLYVEQVESPSWIRYAAPLEVPRPLHCTAIGKLFLADLTDDAAARLLRSMEPTAYTDRTVVDVQDVLADVGRVRDRGYARNDGESIESVSAIAAPVYTALGGSRVLAAGLSLVGPSDRMVRMTHAERRVVAAAEQIGREISSRPMRSARGGLARA